MSQCKSRLLSNPSFSDHLDRVNYPPILKSHTAAKKVGTKKPVTAVDTVFKIINRTKKGVETSALMKKTGFNQKKIHNVVYKLKKQGKVKSVGKGVYLKG